MPSHGGTDGATLEAEINGESCETVSETSLILIFKFAGLFLPRFCFHNNLAIAGSCRACLLEIVSVEKPVAVCIIHSDTQFSFISLTFSSRPLWLLY